MLFVISVILEAQTIIGQRFSNIAQSFDKICVLIYLCTLCRSPGHPSRPGNNRKYITCLLYFKVTSKYLQRYNLQLLCSVLNMFTLHKVSTEAIYDPMIDSRW